MLSVLTYWLIFAHSVEQFAPALRDSH